MPSAWDIRTRNYVYMVFGFTFALNLFLYLQGGLEASAAAVLVPAQMLVPGIVAGVFARREGRTLREYGMRWGKLRYYLVAYGVILGAHALHALLCTVTGLGKLVPMREGLAAWLPSVEISTPVLVLVIFILGPVQTMVFGLGEEFGWRGYLVARLLPHGLAPAILISGVTWGLWHAPLILMGHNFPDAPVAGVFAMTLTMIPLGTILIWLRLKSQSAVVAGFAHATFNATVFLGGAFLPTVGLFWTNPVGLTGFPVFAIIAGLLFRLSPVDAGDMAKARVPVD